ncbi:ubiquitin-like protein Pup [Bifidobacterium rousetti]|uniref:ubiquitin-like protein Pup n=1 Tax=Bifidobacterium rousetti TaxID=2045439 RepID=UPI00123AFE8D|nr:ubiquitin-like protein Pup [Bifidobacterium rousetti]KAA8819845.1 ubiquitin-like protein Pup [Bifidobacterium rousetti]
MPQQFEQSQPQQNGNEQDAPLAAAQTGTNAEIDTDVDALDAVLDDIESTLETNAEEYVNSFVQKGGE